MNSLSVVYPPNRPMERSLIPSKMPGSYDNLFFLDINENGQVIVGCSNIASAYWESVLYHYRDSAAAIADYYSGYYIGSSSTADAKFIQNNTVVLADDNSTLKLLILEDNGDSNIKCEEVFNTPAPVEQLATWNNNDKVIACADTSVIVIDMKSGSTNPLEEYKDYHTAPVTSVDVHKNEINLFASASNDRRACIWDDRMKTAATVLYQNEFNGLTSITWNPKQSDYLVVGTEGGDIYNLDMRQPKEFLNSRSCFNAKVHRTIFSTSGYIAVCGDTSDVLILNGKDNNCSVVYKSNDHSAYVRGLAWFEDTLYSCGFDKKIIKHVI